MIQTSLTAGFDEATLDNAKKDILAMNKDAQFAPVDPSPIPGFSR